MLHITVFIGKCWKCSTFARRSHPWKKPEVGTGSAPKKQETFDWSGSLKRDGRMTQHIKQDKALGTSVAQRKPWSVPKLPSKPTVSANDNDGRPGPLNPVPKRLDGIPSGERKLIERLSMESAQQLLLCAEATAVQPSSRSSWRGTLSVVTYAVGISIAMFGWIYLLWSALAAIVQGISH